MDTAAWRESCVAAIAGQLENDNNDGAARIAVFKQALESAEQVQHNCFESGTAIEELVCARADIIDTVLRFAWRDITGTSGDELELIAVGGYGRGELHPGSDIDLMILLPDKPQQSHYTAIELFVVFVWDIGLDPGHSVRTVGQCVEQARSDITVATALMESRCIAGSGTNFQQMRQQVGPEKIWASREFFEAKLTEQEARHQRYDDTPYKLEPNVKGSPGGLRDIQMIGWVAKRHFGARTLRELIGHGFLNENEFNRLQRGREFLWKIRFALHVLTGRPEDRLLFDHQVRIAEMLGYRNADNNLAVEQLMQRYYRTVMDLGLLNEMLLQLFREAILMNPDAPATSVHPCFQIRNGYLEATDTNVFKRKPSLLLEVFRLSQQYPETHGVSANTIRSLRATLHLIDDEFRADPAHRRLFMEILAAPRYVTHALRRMNAYGVLGRYLPAFGQIVGRMQYDLFHTYTVDAHTLFVVRNLRRFALTEPDPAYPLCAEIMQGLKHPEIVYLAGLFHDIAKGRGGDHSELGAIDAEKFALDHGLGQYEARLVAWLVRQHLILSVTAQKSDIDDPQIIHDFAERVGDEQHLDFLYVLTVADLTGTNPKLWNSWKASLFQALYLQTRRALRRGLENPIDKDTLLAERQLATAQLLASRQISDRVMRTIWSRFPESYFLRHSAEEIAWHTQVLASRPADSESLLVSAKRMDEQGGNSVLVYSPTGVHTFARSTAVLDELGMNILDARVAQTHNGFYLDSFRITETTGEPIYDPARLDAIELGIEAALKGKHEKRVTRKAPRQVRMFSTPTTITFANDTNNLRTIMELTAADRPGLLSRIGRVFMEQDVAIDTAKITTVGERAEDVFYITNHKGSTLSEQECSELHAKLIDAL